MQAWTMLPGCSLLPNQFGPGETLFSVCISTYMAISVCVQCVEHVSNLPLGWYITPPLGQENMLLTCSDSNKAGVYDSHRYWLQTDVCFCEAIATKRTRASILTPASGLSDLSLHHPSIHPSPKLLHRASSGFSLHLGLMPKASQACWSQAAEGL